MKSALNYLILVLFVALVLAALPGCGKETDPNIIVNQACTRPDGSIGLLYANGVCE
jgi:hypothetical protein